MSRREHHHEAAKRPAGGIRWRFTLVLLVVSVSGSLLAVGQFGQELSGAYDDADRAYVRALAELSDPAAGAPQARPEDDAALDSLRVAGTDMREQASVRFRRVSVVVAGLALVLVSALCAAAHLIVFRPLGAMRVAMRELSGGALHRRLGWHRGDEIGALARQFDVMAADLERAHLQLSALALEDPLTGVANQRASQQELAAAVEQARRSQEPLTVGMLDLDHFKHVNDTMGHMTGDDVLRRLGAVLVARLRPADLCGRLGGDEFIVAIADTAAEIAVGIVERIAADLRSVPIGPSGYRPTISVGLAVFPEHGSTGQELLQCADRALYTAKEAGRNTVRVYQQPAESSPDTVIHAAHMWRGAAVS